MKSTCRVPIGPASFEVQTTPRGALTPRMAAKVAFDRKYMPPLQFAVEHELRWVSGGVGPPFNRLKVHYQSQICTAPIGLTLPRAGMFLK